MCELTSIELRGSSYLLFQVYLSVMVLKGAFRRDSSTYDSLSIMSQVKYVAAFPSLHVFFFFLKYHWILGISLLNSFTINSFNIYYKFANIVSHFFIFYTWRLDPVILFFCYIFFVSLVI